jgi:hypothetical protein
VWLNNSNPDSGSSGWPKHPLAYSGILHGAIILHGRSKKRFEACIVSMDASTPIVYRVFYHWSYVGGILIAENIGQDQGRALHLYVVIIHHPALMPRFGDCGFKA